MFKSFDEKTFLKAIEEKDYLVIKSNTVSAIKNDPAFSGSEVKEIIDLLQKTIPEIFEEENNFDFEEHLDEAQWDAGYFSRITFWFQENFALSRLDEIKKVGQKVFEQNKADTLPLGVRKNQNPPQAPMPTKKQIPTVFKIVGVIAVMVALVLVIISILGKKQVG